MESMALKLNEMMLPYCRGVVLPICHRWPPHLCTHGTLLKPNGSNQVTNTPTPFTSSNWRTSCQRSYQYNISMWFYVETNQITQHMRLTQLWSKRPSMSFIRFHLLTLHAQTRSHGSNTTQQIISYNFCPRIPTFFNSIMNEEAFEMPL
jgi:hypothetical protein